MFKNWLGHLIKPARPHHLPHLLPMLLVMLAAAWGTFVIVGGQLEKRHQLATPIIELPTPSASPTVVPSPTPSPTAVTPKLPTATATKAKPTPTPTPTVSISAEGIISYTNIERANASLTKFNQNTALTKAAQARLNDMFAYNYYGHDNPTTGKSWREFISENGYANLSTGENIIISTDIKPTSQYFVQAWMNSPGHKANILKADFINIGVAVGQGKIDGSTVWIAVQDFGA